MSLTNYLTLIKNQRLNNPKYLKDYRVESLTTLSFPVSTSITRLDRWPNARLCKVVQRENPLYFDTDELFYYEFVDVGSALSSTFEDWRYIYVPLSFKDELIQREKLPFYYKYNIEDVKIENQYIDSPTLISYPRPKSTFITTPDVSFLHPYLKNFIFTGHSFLTKQGIMMYEYRDFNMFADHITITYYSKLRPLNFYLESSIVEVYGFENLIVLQQFIGGSPNTLEVYTKDIPNLEFTGRTTNSSFSKKRRWYEYDLFLNQVPINKVLLPYRPVNRSIEFVDISVNNKSKTLFMPYRSSQQSIVINQQSTSKKIKI